MSYNSIFAEIQKYLEKSRKDDYSSSSNNGSKSSWTSSLISNVKFELFLLQMYDALEKEYGATKAKEIFRNNKESYIATFIKLNPNIVIPTDTVTQITKVQKISKQNNTQPLLKQNETPTISIAKIVDQQIPQKISSTLTTTSPIKIVIVEPQVQQNPLIPIKNKKYLSTKFTKQINASLAKKFDTFLNPKKLKNIFDIINRGEPVAYLDADNNIQFVLSDEPFIAENQIQIPIPGDPTYYIVANKSDLQQNQEITIQRNDNTIIEGKIINDKFVESANSISKIANSNTFQHSNSL